MKMETQKCYCMNGPKQGDSTQESCDLPQPGQGGYLK